MAPQKNITIPLSKQTTPTNIKNKKKMSWLQISPTHSIESKIAPPPPELLNPNRRNIWPQQPFLGGGLLLVKRTIGQRCFVILALVLEDVLIGVIVILVEPNRSLVENVFVLSERVSSLGTAGRGWRE